MKKIILCLILLGFTGCTDLSNTPTKRVEDFFKSYQSLDSEVLSDLDSVINDDITLNENQANLYRDIMKNHYQNLTYEIKDDVIDGNNATVTAEITVTDFRKVMNEAESYMNNNIMEFSDEQGNYSILKYNDYRLEKLNNAKDKIKYTIYLNLTKVNDEWVLNDIDQITYDKINGTYFY